MSPIMMMTEWLTVEYSETLTRIPTPRIVMLRHESAAKRRGPNARGQKRQPRSLRGTG